MNYLQEEKRSKTVHRFDSNRLSVFKFMKDEIAKEDKFIVYPLIEESEAMDYKDLMDGYEVCLRVSFAKLPNKYCTW